MDVEVIVRTIEFLPDWRPKTAEYMNNETNKRLAPHLFWVAVCAVILSLTSTNITYAQNDAIRKARIQSQRTFTEQIKPILNAACSDCHSNDESEAGVNLEPFTDLDQILKDFEVWHKVLKEVKSRKMPPDDGPDLNDADREKVVNWLDGLLNNLDCTDSNPGSVTIRRLNRTEYRNTMRDLVGVDYEPSDDFPGDDVGYGFDNIADTLSLPPILMEKYLTAAEEIMSEVIIDPSANQFVLEIPGIKFAKGETSSLRDEDHVLFANGEITTQIDFPERSNYEFKVKAFGSPAAGGYPEMELLINNKVVGKRKVNSGDQEIYRFRAKVAKGRAEVAIAFTNDEYRPERKEDRNLFISHVAVVGPPAKLPEIHERIIFLPEKGGLEQQAKQAREIIKRFASRAFRRSVYNEELEKLVGLYTEVRKDDSYEAAIRHALMAVLISPRFLYKVEQPLKPGVTRALNDFELAQALSYFLWSSMPDDRLFRIAATGKLRSAKVFRSEVGRMLRDEKSTALVDDFAEQWLQLRIVEDTIPDSDLFPTVNERLRADMVVETKMLFAHVVKHNAPVTDLLSADFTFVNGRLAKHYGMKNVSGEKFRKQPLGNQRAAGLLTHGSVLTLTSNPDRTSPVKRGKWILENLLGEEPPPPDPNVMQLEDQPELKGNLRERMLQHRKDPNCAGCHKDMDSLGFALENFDAVGRWRDRDGKDEIDSSGELSDGTKFQGPHELEKILTEKMREQFVRCLAEKMLIYSLGRGLEYFDQCAVDKIVERVKGKEYRFAELLLAIVESDPFLKRRGAGVVE